LHVGDAAGYRQLCSRIVERFGKSEYPEDIDYLAHTRVMVRREAAELLKKPK
jgi:hypothetical protein